ncbi:10021_t:CDS:2 [Ambispora gerdemannii]|uniref:10021_t:CDS:1 n=1 Tax=Ambispora gerdemannii TaxID=144530 RepID=A0A9N8YZM5_9GLOM|nr:10021_t:CDS:2 [Ambispora gerdemannii]
MPNPIKYIFHKVSVKLLAHKCGKETSELPASFQDPEIASIILRTGQSEMPVLIIQWNDQGFNDVLTVPNCRNGIPGQTKLVLIALFVANGGVNKYNANTVFTFRDGEAHSACEDMIPRWARHQPGLASQMSLFQFIELTSIMTAWISSRI